jgi:hypothetical protein
MKKYDPADVVFTFLANIITGFADSSFIKASRNEESWKVSVGADGEACRVRSRNVTGRVTLTLQQSSASNDILSAAVVLDELTGQGVGPLLIKDLSGTLLVVAKNAWVVKPADVDLAKDLSPREWLFECEQLDIFGGASLG